MKFLNGNHNLILVKKLLVQVVQLSVNRKNSTMES